jgi:hypothetical protein
MLIEPLVGAARAAQVAGWHRDGEHDIARHPACPVCHPPVDTPTGLGTETMNKSGLCDRHDHLPSHHGRLLTPRS